MERGLGSSSFSPVSRVTSGAWYRVSEVYTEL